MQITITFPAGFHVDGIVLAATGSQMRVAMKDWDDAAEFQCRKGQWYSENGDPVGVTWPQPANEEVEYFSSDTLPDSPTQEFPIDAWVN